MSVERHSLRLTRYPGQAVVLEIDGLPARYVTGKFTPDVITMVYEQGTHELTDMERLVLAAVAAPGQGVVVPAAVARATGFNQQRVVRLVADLETFGLLKVRRLPKMVSYQITAEGRRCLS
jgi:hypothetical protein